MDEVGEYRPDLFNRILLDAQNNSIVPEEIFFEYVTKLLGDAGYLDDIEYTPYRNSRRGMRIDGLSWNEAERTLSAIVVDFGGDAETLETLTNSDIKKIGKRAISFLEKAGDENFIDSLEVTDPGRSAAMEVERAIPDAVKFRVVILTDKILSARYRRQEVESDLGKTTVIEVWDIDRIRDLDESGSEHEEFTVDVADLGEPIRLLPANISEHGFSTYLGVMPASLLSRIYHEFGQKLLESNVRTFLDFRSGINKGMRKSLLTEPDHFFAYNNGLTVTATAVSTRQEDGQLLLDSLDNMQIVNGGQTTAAIYFSPREAGGIQGTEGMSRYSEIDLNKVFVQMKLTVIEEKEKADEMKANIAMYANSQNSIQQSDLVSNHPFHVNLETRSRKQAMPAGEDGLSTKWFYERARGQYSTRLRALSGGARRRFEGEYPKKQVFAKTDMAKYENTWRMNPHIVKKGAQANLKALGTEIIKEYEKDENAFGVSFYNDLVSKMILFRGVDKAIHRSEWYKETPGFKAEMATYSIALLRHALIEAKKDIDLQAIFLRQSVSENLLETIVSLARVIGQSIRDTDFTEGVSNPSEFAKREQGWEKVKRLVPVDLSGLGGGDVISVAKKAEAEEHNRDLDEVGETIGDLEYVLAVKAEEWEELSRYYARTHPPNHLNVGIPLTCAKAVKFARRMPSDRQAKIAREIREKAHEEGFDFIP